MEFATDPQLMAAVTPDTNLEPTRLLEILEDHWEETGELVTIEEYLMTKQTKTPETTPAVTDAVSKELPKLNEQGPSAIGILYIDSHFHAHFTDEIVRLKRSNASSLYWTAMMITPFGENPTFEDVFDVAPGVASNPDGEIYNKELVPASYAFQNQDERMAVSASQYANVMRNAETIQRNTLVINILKGAGYSADHITREEMFQELDAQQRQRDAMKKKQDDDAETASRVRRKEAGRTVDCGV